jgi:amino acid adenylation domain-containing protein
VEEVDASTIGARLAQVAARFPDNAAIVERDVRITYRQFDRRANAIARAFGGYAGAGRVCLFFQRKLPAIAAMFGAGRAGLAYVVLDAGDPEERLRFIVADCEPALVLTEASLVARARAIAPAGCPIVDVADLPDDDAGGGLPAVAPDAPLYYCYTSGSTGRPKGTLQTHANVLFFFDAYARALEIGANDRLSLLYTLSFNAANTDIFGGLCHGATLCCYDLRDDGVALLGDFVDRERITVFHAIPTMFREMCKRLPAGRMLPYVRLVDLAGEPIVASDVDLLRAHMPAHCVFINQLSSTEAGLIAQHRFVDGDTLAPGTMMPVGRCPPGVRVTIRREDGGVAEVDDVGEIIVSSAHLSPGYWRRPELDAAAFAADASAPGWRNYRSGDLGRIDAEGVLHFMGRIGGRVKIRGHTIHLMEIEVALADCPGVVKAAVTAIATAPGAEPDKLVAYVVAARADAQSPQALRRLLAMRIPAYMLPSTFVFVQALPLTASGKIDRHALAGIAIPDAPAMRAAGAPQDAVEHAIARIFEALLEIAQVGRDDDFFLLGGDSLMASELEMRILQAFGVRIGSFHREATVAALAALVEARRAAPASPDATLPVLIPLWRSGGEVPLFIVHGRHGQAFVSPHFMQLLGDDQPVWAFQIRGLDGIQPPHESIEEMAADYLDAMRRERPHGPYFIASFCAGAFIAGHMARTLREAGETVLPLLLVDPPYRLLTRRFAEMGEQKLAAMLHSRQQAGRTPGRAADPAYMRSAARAALAFEKALGRYQPLPYDGPVYMLSSRQRIAATDPAVLRAIFPGPVERLEVGTTHRDALDAQNPSFAKALLHCVARIRAEAHAHAHAATRREGADVHL